MNKLYTIKCIKQLLGNWQWILGDNLSNGKQLPRPQRIRLGWVNWPSAGTRGSGISDRCSLSDKVPVWFRL